MNALDIINEVCSRLNISPSDFNYIPDPQDISQLCDLYYKGNLCPEKYDPMNGVDFFIHKITQWVLEIKD